MKRLAFAVVAALWADAIELVTYLFTVIRFLGGYLAEYFFRILVGRHEATGVSSRSSRERLLNHTTNSTKNQRRPFHLQAKNGAGGGIRTHEGLRHVLLD
jgi:hypothetical protein